MLAQTSTTLPTTQRSELALIRNDLAQALRTLTPDARALHNVLQRLDALLTPAAPAPRSDHVTKSLFAGW